MKPKAPPAALQALRRAARRAIELAQRTGTSAPVLHNGKVIDAARPARKVRRKSARA
jgi:hypothetical protein